MPPASPTPAAASAARQTWLRHIGDQRAFDRDLAKILRDAATEAERLIAGTIRDNVSAEVRRAQLRISISQLRQQSDAMWGSITPAMKRATDKAIDLGIEGVKTIDGVLANAIADRAVRESMISGASNAVDNVRSRLLNDIQLSPKVYRTQALANRWVQREVNRGIALNMSARDIAKSVRHMIDPNVRGGVSYAARRLARTELNNAFHTTTIRAAGNQPWTEGFKWNLSGSHPRPDDCDGYADVEIFKPKDVPGKPHPQCLCYLTVVSVDEDKFMDSLVAGEYDRTLSSDPTFSMAPPLSRAKSSLTPQAPSGAVTREVVGRYYQNSFDMNSKLRAGHAAQADVQILDTIMDGARTTKPIKSLRVIDDVEVRRSIISSSKYKDASFDDKAFVSTTTDKGSLEDFFQSSRPSERIILEIDIPAGSRAIKMSDYLGDEDFFFDQAEVLIDREAKFHISSVTVDADGTARAKVRLLSTRQSRIVKQ